MKNIISISILALLVACGGGEEETQNTNIVDTVDTVDVELETNALTKLNPFSPTLVPKRNEKMMKSKWLGSNGFRSSLSTKGSWDGFHLLFGVPDSPGTECQIAVELPVKCELSNVYKTLHGANNDTILYTVFFKENSLYLNKRAYIFDIDITANELNSSAIVCELKDYNSTNRAVDQTFFDLAPVNSGQINWTSSQQISGSNLKYRLLPKTHHGQNCSNYELFADLPIWLDYANGESSSNAFIGVGLDDNQDVDKVIFRKSSNYFAFDVYLKQGNSVKDDIAIVEVPLSATDFYLIEGEKYLVRVYDSNGDKKKEKVIVAQSDYEPLEEE